MLSTTCLGEMTQDGVERVREPEVREDCHQHVFSKSVRAVTFISTVLWLPSQDQHKISQPKFQHRLGETQEAPTEELESTEGLWGWRVNFLQEFSLW